MNSRAVMPESATSWAARRRFWQIDDPDNKTILGFYRLSPASVNYVRTPEIIRRGLGRHDVPGFSLGAPGGRSQAARARGWRTTFARGGQTLPVGCGTGWRRCACRRRELMKGVAGWYSSYGAGPLMEAPLTLLLPLATIANALKKAGEY
jgi:hypothetical protein